MSRGFFISFEGIDGAGKTSHLLAAANFLEQQGYSVVKTREPGGTDLAEQLRQLILHQTMQLETEALLLYAARCQHVHEVIKPALKAGKVVLCDRFEDSSFAYQVHAGGLTYSKLQQLSEWALNRFDCTFLFDLPVQLALTRRTHRHSVVDKFENRSESLMQQVRQGFLEQAKNHPQRIRVIQASLSEHEVWQQVQAELLQWIGSQKSCG